MSNKQKRALETIKYFIPDWVKDWDKKSTYSDLGLFGVDELEEGIESEEAFFMKTEQGKLPRTVKNLDELASYLSGQRWMATQIKMWKEGFLECTTHPADFTKEPNYIQEIAKGCCESVGRNWRHPDGKLVGWEMYV